MWICIWVNVNKFLIYIDKYGIFFIFYNSLRLSMCTWTSRYIFLSLNSFIRCAWAFYSYLYLISFIHFCLNRVSKDETKNIFFLNHNLTSTYIDSRTTHDFSSRYCCLQILLLKTDRFANFEWNIYLEGVRVWIKSLDCSDFQEVWAQNFWKPCSLVSIQNYLRLIRQ